MSDDERASVPLILCCAEENEFALVKVVDELRNEGRAPEIVAGVDINTSKLTEAVDRVEGAALFVLCQSDQLDRFQARRLAGLFSARKGEHQRIVTVALHPARPLSVLPAIRSAVKELQRALLADLPVSDSADDPHLRDVVGLTRMTAVPHDPAASVTDPEQFARALHEEMVAAEKALNRGANPQPESLGVVSDPVDGRHPAPASPGVHAVSQSPELGEPALDDHAQEVPPPVLSAATLVSARRGSNRFLLGFALLGITALVTMAMFTLFDSDDEPTRSRRAPKKSRRSAANAPPPSKQAPPAKHAGNTVGSGALSDSKQDPAAPAVKLGGAGSVKTRQAQAEAGGETKAAVAVPPPPEDIDPEDQKIDAAIASGAIRRLDAILVAVGSRESKTWNDASGYCRRRKFGGVSGWRLPSRGEVRRIWGARLAGSGTYWTRTKLKSGDEAYAFDTASNSVNIYLMVEPVARTICVRKR